MAGIARSSGLSTASSGACTSVCSGAHSSACACLRMSVVAAPGIAHQEGECTPSLIAGDAGEGDSSDLVVRFEEWEEWDNSAPFWKHAAAGSCAGVVEHIGMYPLDTVKTHMQALRPQGRARLGEVIREIYSDRRFGFMKGMPAIASGCIPAHIALFTSYEASKRKLLSTNGSHEPVRAAICGGLSTFFHDVILCPMDLVKQRMQLGAYSSIGETLRHVSRHEGLGALYRSMPTTLAMNMPFGSVLVAVNESLKLHLRLDQRDRHSALPWYFFSAGISGAVASSVTQPLDMIKTRLQTQDILSKRDFGSSSAVYKPKYTGFSSALATVVAEEGVLALYNGLLPRMMLSVPAAALCWGTYETVKTTLRC